MPCFHPMDAWRVEGQCKIVFKEGRNTYAPFSLPCGQCIGCRLEKSRQWAVRCMHESQMHRYSSFVTLTYNDTHCPVSLIHRDFQLFMKRLRKQFMDVRFYMCGEYGSINLRPHFHACLFGPYFADRMPWSTASGFQLYRSDTLDKLWPYGFASVGDVTFESAAYCARYVCKKLNSQAAEWIDPNTGLKPYERLLDGEIIGVVPEYARMSLRPAVGLTWINKYSREVFVHDGVVVNGSVRKPPRYYDKVLTATDGGRWTDIEVKRFEDAAERQEDSTPARLAVREVCELAKYNRYNRSL